MFTRVAAVLLFVLLASSVVAAGFDRSGYADPRSGFSVSDRVEVVDTAVFSTGYLSVDGASWTQFGLSGDRVEGSWVVGEASSSSVPSDARYFAIFSCSWVGSWDCSETWQVLDRGERSGSSEFVPDSSLDGQMGALNELYASTNGASWDSRAGWPISSPIAMASAYGIEVDSAGNVVSVDLFDNNLEGFLPESLGNLVYLEFFSVKKNPLFSEVPSTIRFWSHIDTLLLASNPRHNVPGERTYNHHPGKSFSTSTAKYTGSIPDVFDQMPNLRIFQLAWQEHMDPQPFPSTLYKHDSLEILELTGTNLVGELADSFDLPELRLLYIGNNPLEGSLPSSWGRSTELRKLMVSNSNNFVNSGGATHRLSGPLPDSFANLRKLERFFVSNQNLSGEIPSFVVQDWVGLREIGLGSNNFEGSIPPEFGDFDMTVFSLGSNQFSGELHPNLVAGMQRVIIFSVANNNLVGEIPNGAFVDGEWRGWRTKSRLRTTRFTDNAFTGPLPDMPVYVGDMSMLHFHRNKLTGGIPDTWEELFTPSLRNVNPDRTFDNLQMRGNELQGVLPSWFTSSNMDGGVDVRGNRWSHNDLLTHDVLVTAAPQHDAPMLPFGFPEEFSVSAGSSFEFDYSHKVHSSDSVAWFKDDELISGGADGVLRISSVSSSDAGVYRLELTNSGSGLPDTVVSEPLVLVVT